MTDTTNAVDHGNCTSCGTKLFDIEGTLLCPTQGCPSTVASGEFNG